MSARADRPYPPDWCDARTMAYLLDMGESTFLAYVASGLLPEGQKIGGLRRWNRHAVLERLAERATTRNDAPSDDPIMRAAHGTETERRRGTA